MTSCKFVVLTNAVEGKDEEFNDWDTNVQLKDVLKIPGIIGARFNHSDVQRRSVRVHKIYHDL